MSGCTCKDWVENIPKVNGPIALQAIRYGTNGYDGIPLRFCPWCGLSLGPVTITEFATSPNVVARVIPVDPNAPAPEDFDSLANNPAFDFWKDPAEDQV